MSDELAKVLADTATMHDDVRQTLARVQMAIEEFNEDLAEMNADLCKMTALSKATVTGRPC